MYKARNCNRLIPIRYPRTPALRGSPTRAIGSGAVERVGSARKAPMAQRRSYLAIAVLALLPDCLPEPDCLETATCPPPSAQDDGGLDASTKVDGGTVDAASEGAATETSNDQRIVSPESFDAD